jgi:hypothetical protein
VAKVFNPSELKSATFSVFAPPLYKAGNSVKAQKVIEYVADKLNYNLFSPMSVGLGMGTGKGCGK